MNSSIRAKTVLRETLPGQLRLPLYCGQRNSTKFTSTPRVSHRDSAQGCLSFTRKERPTDGLSPERSTHDLDRRFHRATYNHGVFVAFVPPFHRECTAGFCLQHGIQGGGPHNTRSYEYYAFPPMPAMRGLGGREGRHVLAIPFILQPPGIPQSGSGGWIPYESWGPLSRTAI